MSSAEGTALIFSLISFGASVVLFVLNVVHARELKRIEGRQSAELAELNARFQREGHAQSVRYDRLHKHVEEAVLELQPHLGVAIGAFEAACRTERYGGEERPEAQLKRSGEALMRARFALTRMNLFFPAWLLSALNDATEGLHEAHLVLAAAFEPAVSGEQPSRTMQRVEAHKKARAVYSGRAVPAFNIFYDTTRQVFGVDEVFERESPNVRREAKT